MRLTDLHPTLEGSNEEGTLRFDCPLGHTGHRIHVQVGRYGTGFGWTATGEFPDTLSLTPSIHAISEFKENSENGGVEPCGWHGYVTNGEVRNA